MYNLLIVNSAICFWNIWVLGVSGGVQNAPTGSLNILRTGQSQFWELHAFADFLSYSWVNY